MQHISDARYLPKDATLETKNVNKEEENNVKVLQDRYPSWTQKISSFRIISFWELHKIAFGEEPLVHYEKDYKIHRWSRT